MEKPFCMFSHNIGRTPSRQNTEDNGDYAKSWRKLRNMCLRVKLGLCEKSGKSQLMRDGEQKVLTALRLKSHPRRICATAVRYGPVIAPWMRETRIGTRRSRRCHAAVSEGSPQRAQSAVTIPPHRGAPQEGEGGGGSGSRTRALASSRSSHARTPPVPASPAAVTAP